MKKIIMLLFVIVCTTGCVSQKKYEALEEKLAKYKVDDSFQSAETTDVAYNKTLDITELKKQLNNLELENKTLSLKIEDLQKKLNECQ
ncbi:hypothetical protein SAMN05421640_0954 [Ekhidna lutea]|uniref:Uncharacterized protein n=1 Tax=Ekhidna lutea TaxID=447679 RepID=A0A239GQW5_EKHLU|nr:hypothetical protein [Ekhidna lutea]SNS71212.1 hypothetical protein SAMN05421640_0954 [Ekhidna lutea]